MQVVFQKFKKRPVHFSIIFLLIFCSVFFIYKILDRNYYEVAIRRLVDESINGNVDFRKIDNFDWDRIIIIGPYSGGNEANKILGFKHYKNDNDLATLWWDNINILIFVNQNRVVREIELGRDIDIESHVSIPYEKAIFKIVKDKVENGKRWRILKQL